MKYTELSSLIKLPYFDLQDIRIRKASIFRYQLSLWQRQGRLVRLRNGLYAFKDRLDGITPEELAPKVYGPSYISLEKALSYYGIIPEIVQAVTSVTPKTTRTFKTGLGSYIYRHIKPSLYFGYRSSGKKEAPYLIAEPEKALLDMLYFNIAKIRSPKDLEQFRLNVRGVKGLVSWKKLKEYCKRYRNRRMEEVLTFLPGGRN